MLTKTDLTNIVTGILVTNIEKTEQEKSELIIDFLEKENCLKVDKEIKISYVAPNERQRLYDIKENDYILNFILTITSIIAYKEYFKKDMNNLEQTFTNLLFVVAFIVINVIHIIFMYKAKNKRNEISY